MVGSSPVHFLKLPCRNEGWVPIWDAKGSPSATVWGAGRGSLVPGGVWCSLQSLQNGNTAWRSRGFLLVYVKPEDICAVDWTLVSPQIHMLKPVSSVMAFGGRAFGRGLGPESRALMKGMGALIRRGPQSLLPPTLFSTKERRYSFTNQRAGPH